MSNVTIGQEAAVTLRKCQGLTVLHDGKGSVIGYFQPINPKYDPRDIPQFDEAELDRRERSGESISSAEVRRRLEELS